MKVKKLDAFQCPECGEYFAAPHIPLPVTAYQCGECEAIYPDKDEALDCCKE